MNNNNSSSAPQSLTYHAKPGGEISGTFRVPGDKSISHRAIMFGSIAAGTTRASGFLEGEDTLATLQAFTQMGVSIERPETGVVEIHGVGLHGLTAPEVALDVGNSGTSMRLLSGLLAGQAFNSTLTGDRSLQKRPMKRVTEPLRTMGAQITTTELGTAPIQIKGSSHLQGIHYPMPIASAQVKSCLLLAGLYADGETSVTEPAPTRDHTERMLASFGYQVIRKDGRIAVHSGQLLTATQLDIPADISSAAFFLVAASIAKNSELTLQHVGINPTRTGVIDILKLMGADIEISNQHMAGAELVADLTVRSCQLHGIQIPEHLVPLAIDEFPVLFVAAACATGETILTGAEELRVKESDRIQVMADGLTILGIEAQPTTDGIQITGGQITGGQVDSHGDHRIAMAFSMAALVAKETIVIKDCENVNTSFPGFITLAQQAGLNIEMRGAES